MTDYSAAPERLVWMLRSWTDRKIVEYCHGLERAIGVMDTTVALGYGGHDALDEQLQRTLIDVLTPALKDQRDHRSLVEPYYWADTPTRLVKAAADLLPDDTELHEDMVPSDYGFFHFEQPADLGQAWWNVERGDKYTPAIAALSWQRCSLGVDDDNRRDGLILVVWEYAFTPGSRTPRLGLGDIVPAHLATLTFGATLQDGHWGGLGEQGLIGGLGRPDPFSHSSARWVLASFLFLQQQIIERTPAHMGRSDARRVERLEWKPSALHVVALRRSYGHTRGDDDADHRPVDWQWHWLVRGHWRNAYLPSTGGHRKVWIAPFWKGPESKPARVSTHVFAVVR